MAIVVTCSKRTGSGFSRPRCTRAAEFYPAKEWNGDPIEPSLQNIICGFHKGHAERSRYGAKNLVPITDEQMETLREQVQSIRDEQARKAAAQQVEADERERERFAAEWARTESEPGAFLLEREDDRDDEPEFWGFVTPDGSKPEMYNNSRMYRSDHKLLELEPVTRSWFRMGGEFGGGYPYGIRINSGQTLSVPEARALAKVLTEAADKAEELNAERKPA